MNKKEEKKSKKARVEEEEEDSEVRVRKKSFVAHFSIGGHATYCYCMFV